MTTAPLLLMAALWLSAARPPEAEQAYAAGLSALIQGHCEFESPAKVALEQFDIAIKLDGGFMEAHRTAGECLLRLGRPQEALVQLDAAFRLSATDRTTQALLAEARAALTAQAQARPTPAKKTPGTPRQASEVSLGEVARVLGVPKTATGTTYVLTGTRSASDSLPTTPSDAPITLIELMRQRAESVFRPRMQAVAKDVRGYRTARRRYSDACLGKTQTQITEGTSDGAGAQRGTAYTARGSELFEFQSQAAWTERWRAESVIQNETTPECLVIASDIRSLSEVISTAMNGADAELQAPPSVYAGIAHEVFKRLVAEIW